MNRHPECEPMAPGEKGWSEWIHPLPGYLMQCCDCGLTHEMEFEIGRRSETSGPPSEGLNPGETMETVIIFRARRYARDRDVTLPNDAP
jgi:hypothetical protein